MNSAGEKGMEIGPVRERASLLDMSYSDPEGSLIFLPAVDTCPSQPLASRDCYRIPTVLLFQRKVITTKLISGVGTYTVKMNIFPMYLEEQRIIKQNVMVACFFIFCFVPSVFMF